MVKVVLRQEAIDDLNDIWTYTFEEWSEKQADKYYKNLELACSQIGKNPEIGKEYKTIRNNLKGLKSGKHIIFYERISADDIDIIRILHEEMDLISRMIDV